MDANTLGPIFRHLFSHSLCCRRRFYQSNLLSRQVPRRAAHGTLSEELRKSDERRTSNWQQRTQVFLPDKSQEFERYPTVNANALRNRKERPRRVKMLTRDFIDDSLYNPHYGYFSKQATIFTPGKPFEFNGMRDELAFQKDFAKRHGDFEDVLDAKQFNESRQLWHTPTELFSPYYGEAIARYLVTNFKLSHHPYHDLVIYELGAGNGTLMLNILDYLRDLHPEVYSRTKFKIIEISPALATIQENQLVKTASARGHAKHVEIINRSIFTWDKIVPEPCYFIALEVFDNFSHDMIRYDPFTERPMQGQVLIDHDGNFFEFYAENLDPLARRFLKVRRAACDRLVDHPLKHPRWMRRLKASLPFAGNLTLPEFIPTRLLQFFEILNQYFPMHKLISSDFDRLPDAVKGYNAPVVQTRYKRQTIPVTTPFVLQGYFDILFPTNFTVTEDIYRAITGKLTKVTSQKEWLSRWAYTEDTECQNGENPMLSWYENSSVMIST